MIKEILTEIKRAQKIICLRHCDPDGDAIGSSMGLAYFIKENFPKKIVLVDGSRDLEYLDFLGHKDEVKPEDYEGALLIVCDTANIDRIDSKQFAKNDRIIKIDHHPNDDAYGAINWVEENRIAACEMIGELMIQSKWKVPKKSWECIYTGLVTDSNRFMYYGTDKNSFAIAQAVIDAGVDIFAIYDHLYTQSLESYRLKAYIMNKLKITAHGVGYVKLREKDAKRFGKTIEIARSFVNVLSGINEVNVWLIAAENPRDNNIKVSIRSRRHIINDVAQKYGGGGHALAAGAKISNFRELKGLVSDLENAIIEQKVIKTGKEV